MNPSAVVALAAALGTTAVCCCTQWAPAERSLETPSKPVRRPAKRHTKHHPQVRAMKLVQHAVSGDALLTGLATAPSGDQWIGVFPVGLWVFDGDSNRKLLRVPHNAGGKIGYTADGRHLRLGNRLLSLASGDFEAKPAVADLAAWGRDEGLEVPPKLGAESAFISVDGKLMVVWANGVFKTRQGTTPVPDGIDPDWLFVAEGATGAPISALWHGTGSFKHLDVGSRQIAAGGTKLFVFDRQTHKRVADLSGDLSGVIGLTFSADGGRLAALGARTRLVVWDTSDLGSPLLDQDLGADYGSALAFYPRGDALAVGDRGGHLRLLRTDRSGAGEVLTEEKFAGTVNALSFSSDGETLRVAVGPPEGNVVRFGVERTRAR